MKTTFISGISLTLLSMLLTANTFAQKSDYKNEAAYKFTSDEIGKGLPSFSNDVNSSAETEDVNKKVLKHFNKKFYNVTNVKWEQLDDNFLAKFSAGETSTNSLFNNKGKLIYTIIFSSEKQLPAYIKNMVTNKYEDYKITSVAEVLQDNRKIWVVNLSGTTEYIIVRIEDGEMEEAENFQKAN